MYRVSIARFLGGTALASAALASAAFGQDLLTSTPPDGHAAIVANAVSADGTVVVGTLGPASTAARGFVWTEADGISNLGSVADGGTPFSNWFTANGISNDGTIVVGGATAPLLPDAAAGRHAYLWTDAGGFIDLGTLGGLISEALDISGDGEVVVGTAYDGNGTALGFRWSDGDGMTSLGAFDGQTAATAEAASYDGAVIVGTAQVGGVSRAYSWTEADGLVALPTVPAIQGGLAPAAWASDISDDGRTIAGTSGIYQYVAVRWEDGVLFQLGSIDNAYGASRAHGVSGNGEVIVGEGQDGTYTYRAFRWDDESGMLTVEDWLRADGVEIASDVTRIARATNCDGSVVVGELTDGQMFVARGTGTGDAVCAGGGSGPGDPDPEDPDPEGPGDTEDPDPEDPDPSPPGPGNPGLIGLDDLSTSLADVGATHMSIIGGIALQLNGVGSRPLDRRTDEGSAVVWATGDIGRDDHADPDGTVGLGEVGVGHNFGAFQLNGAIGLSGGTYATHLGGTTSLSSTFVKLEAMGELYPTDLGGIWGAITGTALIGSADITRNYLANGGLVDSSSGTAGLQGFGVRGRVQWHNAVPYVSPYGELALSHACMSSFIETGGSFPAAFNGLCSTALDGRLGADVTVPVNDNLRIIGTLELVQRLGGDGGSISGEVTGLGAFDLGATPVPSTWVRAGVGLEADHGNTTFSLMGNATTGGAAPSIWVAAGIRAQL